MPLPLLRAVSTLALTIIRTSHADDVAAPGMTSQRPVDTENPTCYQ